VSQHKYFKIHSPHKPSGDQPSAIEQIVRNLSEDTRDQVLLGVTGSGKTFTMAKVIEHIQRPAIVVAPNKILAAQLYGELKTFFHDNAVEYFVSYYDYYQPEAYVPRTDTYIEKESQINEQIDRMRHSATRSLFEHNDVIIVASVSCIYGIGPPETYSNAVQEIDVNIPCDPDQFIATLVTQQYTRNDLNFSRGCFRVKGDCIDLWPSHVEDAAWKFSFFGDQIESITIFTPLTGETIEKVSKVRIYSNSHFITPAPTLKRAIKTITAELESTLISLRANGKLVEAQRLEDRTRFDLEMLQVSGFCQGIENYSRHLTGRAPGEAPPTLFEYLPENALVFIDESHVTIPQINGMYKGDQQRKSMLVKHGFRLPSCVDNRPLSFSEWDKLRPQTVYVSATPGRWELEQTNGHVIEQIIRPTNLLDPPVNIYAASSQVEHLIGEVHKTISKGFRVLVITLTKKMAEALTEYMHEQNIKVRYLHSDIDTLERISIIRDLRVGVFDVLVGINLLREGLDIPECALVAILDADKEGFLRSEQSLIQIIGRAARNSESQVIMYADTITKSMQKAIDETSRRRNKQILYNTEHNKIPLTISKAVNDLFNTKEDTDSKNDKITSQSINFTNEANIRSYIKKLRSEMLEAAKNLEFEKAANLRDQIYQMEKIEISIT